MNRFALGKWRIQNRGKGANRGTYKVWDYWSTDETLASVSLSARGLWIEMICAMETSEPRGFLMHHGGPIPNVTLARRVNALPDEIEDPLAELEDAGILLRTTEGAIFWRMPYHYRLDISFSEWMAVRAKVFERDNYTCRYCGSQSQPFDCDHVNPVSKGGLSVIDNLVTACAPCNRSKGAKTIKEWMGYDANF